VLTLAMGYEIKASQKIPLPRCPQEIEEGGGSHSWFTQCSRAIGHLGDCRFNLSQKERLEEGTFVYNIESQIAYRERKIAELEGDIANLRAEIQNLCNHGEP